MSARHATCGTLLRWKSTLDDELEPALVPWCDLCDTAAAIGEVRGDLADIPILEADVADQMRLVMLMHSPQ